MDLPQAQTTSVGVASQASQEQVSGVDCWYRLRVSIFRLIVSSVIKLNQLKKIYSGLSGGVLASEGC